MYYPLPQDEYHSLSPEILYQRYLEWKNGR